MCRATPHVCTHTDTCTYTSMHANAHTCIHMQLHCHVTLAEHTEDIVMAVFQYLEMVRREGPKEWIFRECAVGKGSQCSLGLAVAGGMQ